MARTLTFRDHYDLAVVGGGIHGAAVAWEAVSRGLSVVLLEGGDFASGASANSLKIIHGGLRYLQHLDFRRARESAAEQLRLGRLAPHLIRPLPCVMPTYREFAKSRLAVGLGLKLYRYLVNGSERDAVVGGGDRLITVEELYRLVPARLGKAITGGALWHDAQVYNSERLVIEFIMSARSRGADTVNYARVEQAYADAGRVRRLRCRDALTDRSYEIACSSVVYATGAYGRDLDGGLGTHFMRAVNLILPVPWGRHALGVAVPAGRAARSAATRLLFFVPWRERTMVGTWYFPDQPSLGDRITEQELSTCLADVRSVIDDGRFDGDSIDSIHVGRLPIRPGSGPAELRERFEICGPQCSNGPRDAYWLIGTKYTTARQAAAQAVEEVMRDALGRSATDPPPDQRLDAGSMHSFLSYLEATQSEFDDRLRPDVVYRLVRNYGKKTEVILRYAEQRPELFAPIPGAPATIKAELDYVVEHEMAYCLDDVLCRRTDLATLKRPHPDTVVYCREQMSNRYAWDRAEQDRQTRLVDAHFDKVVR